MSYKNKSIEGNINKYLLNKHIKDYAILSELIKPTIAIKRNEKNTTLSKFGGIPSFSKRIDLEGFENKSLSFVCQISIDDIKLLDPYNYLPNGGFLYFFINTNFSYPIKSEDFKVVFLSDKNDVEDCQSSNLKSLLTFKETFIEFYLHYNFPSYQNWKILELEDQGIDLYDEIEEIQDFINENANYVFDSDGSQLFGNPQALQGAVSFHWAASSLDFNYPFSDEELKKIKKLEKEFILLLQIDFSEIKTTKQFGDGMFYFGIREKDLIKSNFDNIQLVYQST